MKVFWTLVLSMHEKLLQMVLIVIFGAGAQLVKVITIQLSELSRMNLNGLVTWLLIVLSSMKTVAYHWVAYKVLIINLLLFHR